MGEIFIMQLRADLHLIFQEAKQNTYANYLLF